MSFFSRLWNAVRRPVRYVGRDLEGNRFFEAPSPNDPSRPKRTIQYYDPEAVWKYVGGGKRLPIQWSAWLTHTRKCPPTLEELQADFQRQQRVLANVAMIEARDRAESEQRLRLRQQDAAKALEEATARAIGSSQVVQPSHVSETLGPEAATGTWSKTNEEPNSAQLPSTSSEKGTNKTKFQPPKFLTPATPRKPKSTIKFQLPPLEDPAASSTPESEYVVDESSQKSSSSNPFSPRPASETESWSPKARQRG